MSNYHDNSFYPQQPPTRHRRSDKHRGRQPGEDAAPVYNEQAAPETESAQQEIQWERRQPSSWPEESAPPAYNAYARRADQDDGDIRARRRQSEINDDFDDAYDDEERRFPWVKVLIGLVAAMLLFCVALYFIEDAGPLNPLKQSITGLLKAPAKAQGEVLSFQTVSNSAVTGSRLQFNVTTNQSVDSVRIEDAYGKELACEATLMNGENETNKIWNINVIFDSPYTGDVYAAIREGDTWKRSDKSLPLIIADPTPAPTEEPLQTQVPLVTPGPTVEATEQASPAPVVISQETPDIASVTWAPTNSPLPTEGPTPEPTPEPTEEPTPEPTETPEPTPDPTASPGPTPAPTVTPLPHLEASAEGDSMKTTDTVFVAGKKDSSFNRAHSYIATHPDNYTYYPLGVFTFRGDNFRRNAAFGTAEVKEAKLSVLWQTPIGSLRTADSGTLYGVGWTGQPAIVKWTREVRQMMNVFDEKKSINLIEVIFGAQDGKIYFLDLRDGSASRETINVGYPLKGSVSIDSFDRPLLAVGQGISKLSNKTGAIGLHIYNLMDGKEAYFLNGRKTNDQAPYSSNGAFDGTALFLFDSNGTDALITAGENGLLYTLDLNGKFIYPNDDNPDATPSMEIKPSVTFLKTKAADEKDTMVSVESSVAMYDRFIFMADAYGVIRCVDSDTMKTVWAFDGGDNIDAAIALDMDGTDLSLYTGNTNYARLGSKKDVSIRRINALTGKEIWCYNIKCAQDKKNQASGCKASPIIGQNRIGNLVIFTVNMVEGGGSKIIALNKQSGAVVWEHALPDEAVSSPVAVYNARGDAWIIQGDEGGNLTMLDGLTGTVRSTLNLGGAIQGSPAVYKDYLVIGTCSKDNAYMYCLKIQ
ncbi:MAG: PQQ-binding-like beta-propeller repeat protein [Clostridia bacterium]|nr:PQQ-binding-like beta-propeller repeat protein [Clostridia bacterium]